MWLLIIGSSLTVLTLTLWIFRLDKKIETWESIALKQTNLLYIAHQELKAQENEGLRLLQYMEKSGHLLTVVQERPKAILRLQRYAMTITQRAEEVAKRIAESGVIQW